MFVSKILIVGIFSSSFLFSNHTQIASSKLDESRNVVADGGNIDDSELNQLFVPYRGYCARKGVSFLIQAFR